MADTQHGRPTEPAPLSDDDTFAVIDHALTALAARRRLNLGDDHDVMHLLASLIEQAERFLPRGRHQRPGQRLDLGPNRPPARHQPRRSPPALRPGLTHRRQPMALQLLKTNQEKTAITQKT